MILSMCFRAVSRPFSSRYLNSVHSSDVGPPITSTNSGVNLNGDCSKPRFFGEMLRMKPKSMWIRWPSACSRMFPLCLQQNTEGRIDELSLSPLPPSPSLTCP